MLLHLAFAMAKVGSLGFGIIGTTVLRFLPKSIIDFGNKAYYKKRT